MIFDKISELDSYRGISKNLDDAFDYFLKTDFSKIEPGMHIVVSDTLFINLFEFETKKYTEGVSKFETHRDYIDVHIPLRGSETIECRHASGCRPIGEYNAETDMMLYEGDREGNFYTEHEGEFLLCFPQDAHIPDLAVNDEPKSIRKLVLKVKVEK